MHLKAKVAVVTGATSGLGLEFSKRLVDRGSVVYGLARRADKLAGIESELGDRFHGLQCDVSDDAQVGRAIDTALEGSDRIDILVNNAGLGRFGPVEELTLEDWDVQMNVNLRGVFLCTKAVIPVMKAQNAKSGFGGHIVNISSVAGLVGNPLLSAYNATKFGLKGFSEALMKEVREDGIKVTCFYPGSIQTEFFDTAGVPISAQPLSATDIGPTLVHVLETPDNYLISEVVMRPLRPNG
ncbi:MAG: SDR family oxidoreductase [Bacteroidetes bacterium]|nr:SDR family oxidoreductase [Bacteroidota bacterium]